MNITLVTGGARSGKSDFAEDIAKGFGDKVLYIATSIPFDDEMRDRVKKHRLVRPSSWDTYEGYENLDLIINKNFHMYDGVLLDCVTLMTSNLMFKYIGDEIDRASIETLNKVEEIILDNFKKFIESIIEKNIPLVLVTNELGCGIVPDNKLARIYRDIAGRVNQYVGSKANNVYLLTCGIPIKIK